MKNLLTLILMIYIVGASSFGFATPDSKNKTDAACKTGRTQTSELKTLVIACQQSAHLYNESFRNDLKAKLVALELAKVNLKNANTQQNKTIITAANKTLEQTENEIAAYLLENSKKLTSEEMNDATIELILESIYQASETNTNDEYGEILLAYWQLNPAQFGTSLNSLKDKNPIKKYIELESMRTSTIEEETTGKN